MTSRFFSRVLSLLLLGFGVACASPPKDAASKKDGAAESALPKHSRPLGALLPGEPRTAVPVEADDVISGDGDALVTVVAFLDFECPYCREGFGVLESLRQRYKMDELRIVLKHLPLDGHPDALPAAIAAQAVQQATGGEAGFEYARALFAERSLDAQVLSSRAEELGVDKVAYAALVEAQETVERVILDLHLARRLGVQGTPAFFINGAMIGGVMSETEFASKIDAEAESVKVARQSSPSVDVYQKRVATNVRGSLAEILLAQDPMVYQVPVGSSAAVGSQEALVTLVVFSDFECPYCKRADATVQALRRRYPNDLRIVFKHLPLPFHSAALPAARIAEAVRAKKGDEAFFSVAQKIFETQTLDAEVLDRIGATFGLSAEERARSLDGSSSPDPQIQADLSLAADVEARGTPHFFVNGRRLSGARPLEQFEAVIDKLKTEAEALVRSGVSRGELYSSLIAKGVRPGVPTSVPVDLSEKDRPTRGSRDASLVVHVFSDFQCPFCRRAEATLMALEASHPGQLRIVWHDLPLEFHKQALPAARSGREAFRQKGEVGFWRMHGLLFGLDGSISRVDDADLREHARALGLNLTEFEKALDGARDQTIEEDKARARSLEINGTPAFIVTRPYAKEGYFIRGAVPEADFERVFRAALKE